MYVPILFLDLILISATFTLTSQKLLVVLPPVKEK